jgi:NAD/NADP transhydrogenase beta subunit
MNRIINHIKDYGVQLAAIPTLLFVKTMCYADEYTIPTSSIEQTQQGQSVLTTGTNMFKQEYLPLIELVLGILIGVFAVLGAIYAYRKAKEKDDPSIFYKGIVMDLVLVVIGGIILYILHQYQQST